MSGIFIPFGLDPLVLQFSALNVTPANTYVTLTGAPSTTLRASSTIAYTPATGHFKAPQGIYLGFVSFLPGYALGTAVNWHFGGPTELDFLAGLGRYHNSVGGDALNPIFGYTSVGFALAFDEPFQARCTTANNLSELQIVICKLA